MQKTQLFLVALLVSTVPCVTWCSEEEHVNAMKDEASRAKERPAVPQQPDLGKKYNKKYFFIHHDFCPFKIRRSNCSLSNLNSIAQNVPPDRKKIA